MQQLSKVKRQHKRLYPYILFVLILSSLIGFTSPSAIAANESRAPRLQEEQEDDGCGNILPVVTVTTTTELINAINSANCQLSDNTINLQAGHDFMLTSAFDIEGNTGGNGLPFIGTAVTNGKLTINGNGAQIRRDLNAPAFRILYVARGADLTLNDVAISQGFLPDNGGAGIYNRGTLTINHSTIGFNRALGAGGIYNDGTLTISDSLVFGNRTGATNNGAGIINLASLTIRNSLFSGNIAGGNGGAIFNTGNIDIVNSTFSGNQAASGGAIYNNQGGITMSYTTVAANSSGLFNLFGAVYLANSILADSTGGPDCVQAFEHSVRSFGVNIVEDNGQGISQCELSGTLEVDPQLGLLQDNGGPTQTRALLPGSPAINAGTNTLDFALFGAAPTTDQRGLPRIVGTMVDIGAYEVADTDGITDAIENAAPHGGDGNQDGIRDSLQSSVVSFPNASDGRYLTLVAPTGTEFVEVQSNPAPADAPARVNFPLGIITYRLQRIAPGSRATVEVIDYSSAAVTTYYKFGPTPGQLSPHWYAFVFDGSSGVNIVGNQISVNVVDGGRGDNDLTVNGEIAERGGLALLSNQPPVADSGFATTHEDIPTAITLSASDGNSDPLTFTVANPTHGTLTGTPPNLTYTPNTDFHGSDSFTFTATDGTAVSNLATVTITVMSINDAPVAADDTGSLNEDTALNVPAPGVLLNDTDVDFDPLTAVLSSDPANGVLVLNGDGSFSYTPTANFSGTDAFTYNACDIGNPTRRADDLCDAATVTITVTPVTDAPLAADDTGSLSEDTALNVPAPGVLLNDTDVDSDPLTAILSSDPANGVIVLNGDGSFSYTPNPNFNGTDAFTYSACDTRGTPAPADDLCDAATMTITVTPVNDTPVAADDTGNLNEDTALNMPAPGVLLNDTDVDSDALTTVLISDPANGVLVLNGDGSFSYTPNANFSGTDAFTYHACDTGGTPAPADDLCDAAAVTITITPVNDVPTAVIAAPTMDQIFSADPTGSATVTFNAAGSSDPDGSIVSYAWSWTGTSAGNATGGATAQAFGAGSYSLTLTVTDDDTATDTETVNFSVQAAPPTNQAPTISPVADQTTKQGETIAPLMLSASDPDGDALTFTVTNFPLGLSFNPANRQISGTVDVNAITTTVTVSVSDGVNPAVSLTFGWNISDDVAPTFTPANQTNTAGDGINLSLAAFANDPETPALRFDLIGGALPSGLSLATNGTVTGIISGSATGYTPTIRVTDNIGQTVSASFTWTVTASAGPTTATFQVNQAADDVNEVNTTYTANDPTVWIGNGGTANTSFLGVRFNGVTIPPGSTIQSATLQVYSTANQWISVSVQIAGQAADTSLTFSTGSRPSARPLTTARVTSTTNAQWLPNTWYDYPGLQAVVQEIVNRTGWQSGNSLSLIFKGLGPGSWGRKLISSYDGDPAHAPRLVISYAGGPPPPNQPPFVKLDNPAATAVAVEGQAATTITGTFGDPDNNPVTLTPSLGTLQINGNAWTWNYTPADGPVNTTVTISAKDSQGALALPPVTFNLNVSNVAPTAVFAAQPASAYVNNAVALTFSSPVDVVADLGSLTYTVDCGNGSAIQTVAPFSCTYASVGTFTALGTVTDKDGGSTSYQAIITVSATSTAPTTITPQVNASSDDVNQTGNVLDVNKPQIWVGTEGSVAQSYTGLRFNNLSIPAGATITEAHLEFYTTANTWIAVDVLIAADATDNSVTFNNANKPSTRSFTTTRVTHHSNVQWLANSWNTLTGNLAGVVQEVVSRAGWQSGNSLSIILKGSGSQWARKFATSYEGNPAFAPRLVISYTPPAAAVTTNNDPPIPLNQTIPNPPSAAFSAGQVTGTAPLAVQFTNASTGDIAGYAWNFGDGAASTDLNPAHTYTAAGSYTVTLVVTGTDATTSTAQVVITVTTPVVLSTETLPPTDTPTPVPTDTPTDVPVVTTPLPPKETPTQPPDVAEATTISVDQPVSP